jgi:hypothetical protein
MEAFDIPALHALCIELSIPGPAAEACLAQAASAQTAPLLRHIPALLDASRAEAAMRELQAKCAPLCPNGLLELAVLLSAALEARKHYAARGVPDDVYLATMGCFSRFLNETLDRPLAVRPRLLGLAAALRAAAPPRHTGIRGASPAR